MKLLGIAICAIVASVVLYAGVALFGSTFHIFTLPFIKLESKAQTNEDIIKKTYNADNALAQYHWFQEEYAEIQSTQSKMTDAEAALKDFEVSAGPRDKWAFDDRQEDSRLRTVVQGLKSHYNDVANAYDAKAKETDRAVFKDNLPLFVGLQ